MKQWSIEWAGGWSTKCEAWEYRGVAEVREARHGAMDHGAYAWSMEHEV
jgi:hypothetical protein